MTTPQPAALPDLTAVIAWLENGCDPSEAVKELKHYQSKLRALAALQSQPAAAGVSDADIYALWVKHCETPGTTTRQLVCGFARAALSEAKAGGWQDISTAPDGTMILCANMNAREARDWCFVAWMAGGKVCGHRMDKPTHWQPLPAPPAQKEPT